MPSKRPTFVQAIALALCGAAMFFFGCLGALSGMERPPSLIPMLGVGLMYAGGAAILVGIVLLLFVIARGIVSAFTTPRSTDTNEGN